MYSRRLDYIKASDTRELLRITQYDDFISLAGGLPAPEGFPIKEIDKILNNIILKYSHKALQYSSTEGYVPLRKLIAERINKMQNCNINYDNVLITSGSQQALDLLSKVFLDEKDKVIMESPTYMAAINAFNTYMPELIGMETDNEGMDITCLREYIEKTDNIKLIYIIPDFQNPTGRVWSLKRRLEFIKLMNNYNIRVIEDSPYYEIRFEDEKIPTIFSLSQKKNYINVGTFSKTLCPGLRQGWIVADKDVINKLALVKQSTDLHTPILNQMIVAEYLRSYNLDDNIKKVTDIYNKRCRSMLGAIYKYFPDNIIVSEPKGGMFVWVELPEMINTRELYYKALENKVAFVPGDSFYPQFPKNNCMRLNFSNMPEDIIEEGIKRISNLL